MFRSIRDSLHLACVLALSFSLAACGDSGGKDKGGGDGDNSGDGDGGGDGDLPPLTKTPSAKVPPKTGALFGAFVQVGENGGEDAFQDEEKLISRHWVIDNRFYSANDDWVSDRTKWDVAQHKIPLVTWEPHEHNLDDLVAGKHDDVLKKRAQAVKALGAQIFLRWGHEMNGNWYEWSGAANGGEAANAPAKYIAAWRHVHDLFKKEGATNVVWVWCPLVADVPNEPWNHWTNYYPGDDYVDWVGLDAYNWGSSSNCCVWQSFPTLIRRLYVDYAGKKPLIIPETASAELGGSKAEWIDEMHTTLMENFPEIKAVVWFDIKKETDWQIASSPAALKAYKAMALDPYFNPKE
jgi:hypothetical protein